MDDGGIMLATINHDKKALEIVVFDTRDDKEGILKVVWPPLFRGLEEPNEFYPSVASAKLKAKFYQAHPQPFQELNEVYRLGLTREAMAFVESPLRGKLEGLCGAEEVEMVRKLEYAKERMEHFVFHPFGTLIEQYTAANRSEDLEDYLCAQNAYDHAERELGQKYCGWLAKQCGQGMKSGVEADPLPAPVNKGLDCLRRDEFIAFSQFSPGYGTKDGFDMERTNRDAFLSLYEQCPDSCRGNYVLMAYGREFALKETMEEISAIATRLKLLEAECLKARLDRETFLGLAKR